MWQTIPDNTPVIIRVLPLVYPNPAACLVWNRVAGESGRERERGEKYRGESEVSDVAPHIVGLGEGRMAGNIARGSYSTGKYGSGKVGTFETVNPPLES